MPDSFPDDSWDELTRELGVEKAPPTARDPESAAPEVSEAPLIDDEPPDDGGEFDGELGDEGESDGEAPDGTEPPAGDEQPGGGRKRRRRRRRRRKVGAEGEATEGAGDETAEPVPVGAPAEEQEIDDAEFDSESLGEVSGAALAADEDTAGEMLRELIAGWNVPSWDAIITGLNRPER
jgi:hypothetical protein